MTTKSRDHCERCGIPIPHVDEDADPAANLCDTCYEAADVSSYEDTIEVLAHRVTIRWWGAPLEEIKDYLKEEAEEHVTEMITRGYTSGELLHEDDRGVSLSGYWEIKKE